MAEAVRRRELADLLGVLESKLPPGIDVEVATAMGRAYALDRSGSYSGEDAGCLQGLVTGEGRNF